MNILKINSVPSFEVIFRAELEDTIYKIILKNELKNTAQEIICAFDLLPNENFNVVLNTFPVGVSGTKFSYKIVDSESDDIVCFGKLMIVAQNENVQDYSKKTSTKFYK
jgi:hypothetical protein